MVRRSSFSIRGGHFLLAGLMIVASTALLLSHFNAPARAASPIFPSFTNQTRILDPSTLTYNPTGEIVFPSIINVSGLIASPLGTYYLYYAPHDAPGGISLAYANSLEGPWTEYAANPVISNNWSPNYSVSHVSSPDVVWNQEAGKFYLYFHGENNITRLANSTDGVHFTYDRVAVDTTMFNNISEASYARVYRYTMPAKANVWTMTLMGNNAGNRKIYLAWSNDGRTWTTQRDPFITPTTAEGTQASGANYLAWNGKQYIVYHTSNGTSDGTGDMYAVEVNADFTTTTHVGMFYQSLTTSPDDSKTSAPDFITVGSTLYMFYETGERLEGRLAWAKASLTPSTPTPTPPEVIVDNANATGVTMTGSWVLSTGAAGYYGSNYLHDDNAGKGSKSVRFTPTLPSAHNYEVYARWSAHSNRATNIPIAITYQGGTITVTVNQQTNGGVWYSLGIYSFAAGNAGYVVISNTGTNGYVVADAIRFVQR